jgi:hypothetical protein
MPRHLRVALLLPLGALALAACTGNLGNSPPDDGLGGNGGGTSPGTVGSGGSGRGGSTGATGTGGSAAGGSTGTTGTGGSGTAGGTGTTGTGGRVGTGGTTGTTGTGGRVGTGGTAGSGAGGSGGVVPPQTGMCGTATVGINSRPFGCKFGWGATNATGRPAFLDFVTTWVGDETNGGLASFSATATNNSCGDCTLVQQVASGTSMVVFYSYFIGFQACKQGGFCDCNTDTDGHTLCTDGAQWIKTNRAVIVNMYAQYAKRVYAVSPNKPVIWWLEGDFVQYSYAQQSSPLSYADLGSLARDITCAIKANEPNAIVAMNHSPWITIDQANGFWDAQPVDVMDLVWVQGYGDSGIMPNTGTYNASVSTYTWLRQKTGRPIMAETSFAAAGVADRWTTTTAANINQRITDGIVGVNIVNPAANLQTAIQGFALNAVCQ